jgi:CDP-glucose 4,6-dehydratase
MTKTLHGRIGMNKNFWKNKKVFLTGHTGFKGSWMSLWLTSMGANVTGYSIGPVKGENLFSLAELYKDMNSIFSDILDLKKLKSELSKFQPDIVIHMAAQSLVGHSYREPVETYTTNIIGTVNILEALRYSKKTRVFINVTSDKCYENKEWDWGYRENDRLGGADPYSSSKACSELVTSSFNDSFFKENSNISIATVRAGNVIGGGDWSEDRLIPDILNSILNKEKVKLRCPNAVRPWQNVLEPLRGYLMLAEKLFLKGSEYSGAWNFGPSKKDEKTVRWIVESLHNRWSDGLEISLDNISAYKESSSLRLDSSKSNKKLDWQPLLDLDTTLDYIVNWNKDFLSGIEAKEICMKQIKNYEKLL